MPATRTRSCAAMTPSCTPPRSPSRRRTRPTRCSATISWRRSTCSRRRIRIGARRVVNLSSETVPGHSFAERSSLPAYVPVDEDHPVRPQDPYAPAKHFGEQLMDGAAPALRHHGVLRPPVVGPVGGQLRRDLGPAIREPTPTEGFFGYIDVYDLADAIRLAAESDTPGHDVVYIASPDNFTREPLAELVARLHGDRVPLRAPDRPDASGITIAKAPPAPRLRPDALLARLPRRDRHAATGGPRAARARRDRRPTGPAAERCRVLRAARVADGGARLEPALQSPARPVLPAPGGVEAQAGDRPRRRGRRGRRP